MRIGTKTYSGPCLRCDKPVDPARKPLVRRANRFCSEYCRVKVLQTRAMRSYSWNGKGFVRKTSLKAVPCVNCGKMVEPTNGKHRVYVRKYCDKACKMKGYVRVRDRLDAIIGKSGVFCIHCGRGMSHANARNKFCSKPCRLSFHSAMSLARKKRKKEEDKRREVEIAKKTRQVIYLG